mgnify:CR=1 FL=1
MDSKLWPPGCLVWMRAANSDNLHVADSTDHEGRPHGICGSLLNPHAPAGTHARCPRCEQAVSLPLCSDGSVLRPVWSSRGGWDLHCVTHGNLQLGAFPSELELIRYYRGTKGLA